MRETTRKKKKEKFGLIGLESALTKELEKHLQKRFDIIIFKNIDQFLKSKAKLPSFVLIAISGSDSTSLDRLKRMGRRLDATFVFAYYSGDELSEGARYRLHDKGVIRVFLGREISSTESLADSIYIECQDIEQIAQEVEGQNSSRQMGTRRESVGNVLIDRYYHCWYSNDYWNQCVGSDITTGIYWNKFYGHPIESGPCWDSLIHRTLHESRVPFKERGRSSLVYFRDGQVRWIHTIAKPIMANDTDRIIAVWVTFVDLGSEYGQELPAEARLHRIACGLVHSGFGNARIYKVDEEDGEVILLLKAYVSRDDETSNFDHRDRFPSKIRLSDTAYAKYAFESGSAFLATENNWAGAPTSFPEISIHSPHISIPIRDIDDSLCASVCLDFSTQSSKIAPEVIQRCTSNNTIDSIGESYGREIRRVFSPKTTEIGIGSAKNTIFVELQAELGAAQNISDLKRSFVNALDLLYPECWIGVHFWDSERRILTLNEGISHAPLSARTITIKQHEHDFPRFYMLENEEDAASIAIKVVNRSENIWIDDLQHSDYDHKWGTKIKSAACVSLNSNGRLLGTLSIGSLKPITWDNTQKNTFVTLSRHAVSYISEIGLMQEHLRVSLHPVLSV